MKNILIEIQKPEIREQNCHSIISTIVMQLAQDPFGPLPYAHFQNVDHEMEERHFCASFNMLLNYKIYESQEKKYKKLKCADK